MFARLASFVSRHWLIVLVVWVGVLVGLKLVAPRWDDITRDGDFAYLPPRMTSVRGEKLMAQAFPSAESKSELVLVVGRPKGRLRDEDYAVAGCLAETFAPKPGESSPVTSVLSYDEPVLGHALVSRIGPNGQALLVILQLNSEFMEVGNMAFVNRVYKTLERLRQEESFPKGLEIGVTGTAAVGTDMLFASAESIRNTEWTTILLVVGILFLVYRAPGLVVVPLVAIVVSFFVSCDLIAILARWSQVSGWFDFKVFKTTEIFIVVILFGAATDYCLFLIARYREELERGLAPAEAIQEALSRTGHALTASAMTTILGLGTMLFADFGKYRYGRADDRIVAGGGPGGVSDRGAGLAAGPGPERVLAFRRGAGEGRPTPGRGQSHFRPARRGRRTKIGTVPARRRLRRRRPAGADGSGKRSPAPSSAIRA